MQRGTVHNYINIIRYSTLTNWSASFALGNNMNYNKAYSLVKIGSLIVRNRNKVIINDEANYKRVTIKLYGKGVILRDEVNGKTIGTKNQFIVSAGQFIMSKIDARNGAFGLVPEELHGAAVTQDFLSYNINTDLVIPDFFLLLTTTKKFLELCQRASSGTTGRQRVDESIFLGFEIPLPDLKTQDELITLYKSQLQQAQKYRDLIKLLKAEINTLITQNLGLVVNAPRKVQKQLIFIRYKELKSWGVDNIFNINDNSTTAYPTQTLSNIPHLVKLATRGKSPVYSDNGPHTILNQKCNRWNNIQIQYSKKVEEKWYSNINPELFTKEGDIIINSTGEGTIGRVSLITKEHEGYIYDSHMLLLRLDAGQINPLFLVYILNSEYGQDQINNLKSAKSTKQTELGIQNLMKINFPLPEKSIQDEFAVFIAAKEKEISELEILAEKSTSDSIADFERIIFN